MKHLEIIVEGRVQGVFYRASTRDKARELGLAGYVMNQPDGSVLIRAEGEVEVLTRLIDWCHQGPRNAAVTHVHSRELPLENFNDFTIKRS